MTKEPTPNEVNLKIAHKALVNAKYALNAVACSTSSTGAEASAAESYAAIADALVGRVHALRFNVDAQVAS